jgi:predicted dienelactone hydrolase
MYSELWSRVLFRLKASKGKAILDGENYKAKAVTYSLVQSRQFGKHIDVNKVGVSGHSFGGFTALAIAGGPVKGNVETVSDARV